MGNDSEYFSDAKRSNNAKKIEIHHLHGEKNFTMIEFYVKKNLSNKKKKKKSINLNLKQHHQKKRDL